MSTLVLVHGSWGGGWVWDKLRPLLADFEIITPTLSGSDHAGLESHIGELLAILDTCQSPVLVGHSYGGLVATLAASRRPDAVGKLVVLDGFLAREGKSIFDLHPEIRTLMDSLRAPATPSRISPAPAEMLGIPAGDEALWYDQRAVEMPAATHEDRVSDALAPLGPVSCHYIRCTGFPIFGTTEIAAGDEGWQCSASIADTWRC